MNAAHHALEQRKQHEQRKLIDWFNAMNDEQRGMLLIFARQLAAEIIHSAPNVLPFKLAGQTRPRADI